MRRPSIVAAGKVAIAVTDRDRALAVAVDHQRACLAAVSCHEAVGASARGDLGSEERRALRRLVTRILEHIYAVPIEIENGSAPVRARGDDIKAKKTQEVKPPTTRSHRKTFLT
jgi:hypothetical protein